MDMPGEQCKMCQVEKDATYSQMWKAKEADFIEAERIIVLPSARVRCDWERMVNTQWCSWLELT